MLFPHWARDRPARSAQTLRPQTLPLAALPAPAAVAAVELPARLGDGSSLLVIRRLIPALSRSVTALGGRGQTQHEHLCCDFP